MKFIFTILMTCLIQLSFAQIEQKTIKVDKRIRNFIVYKPKNFHVGMPLVINMHGFTMTGSNQMNYTVMNKKADEAGFVVIYPSGLQKRWGSGTFFGVVNKVDDVNFTRMMIDYMQLYYGIDPSKVYSTGYSAGGFMSYRLACEIPGRIAAIAPVASSMIYEIYESCNPEKRIPIMIVNGTTDPVVAYNGIPGNFPSVDKVVELWSKESVCDPVIIPDTLPNIEVNDNSRVVKTWYPPCTDTKGVLFYKILYGGHTWPGSGPLAILGNTNQDIKLNDEMWDFFNQYQIAIEDFCALVENPSVNVSDCSATLTWNAVEGATSYRIVLHNLQTREFVSYSSSTPSLNLSLSEGSQYRWSVGVNCASGSFRSTSGPDFSACTGINGRVGNLDEKFLLYPNPASNQINVFVDEANDVPMARILDYSGKTIKEVSLYSGLNEINIEGLAGGMYILQTTQGSQTFVKL